MAQRLKNTLTFAGLAPGATVVLPHGLEDSLALPLEPDHIVIPSQNLFVTADDENVTLLNQGPVDLSGSVLVEAWHSIERSFGDIANEDLPVKPYITVSAEASNEPPQPPFVHEDIFIYVRLTGSDADGDGTLANPYRTVQRAIRDVPSIIPARVVYRVDCTGIGTETLPEMYHFPVFIGAEGIGEFEFSERYFHYYNSVNIQADPQLATGVTGITSIPLVGAFITVPKASTKLTRITFAGAGWTPGELKGKFAITAGLAPQHSVIWDNGADWIDLTSTSLTPTFPIEIMECSAHLQAEKDPNELHLAAINIKNSQLGLLGIKVSSMSSAAGAFGGWGLQVAGPLPVSLQLCDIRGAGFVTTEWTRARQCYLPDSLFMMAPLLLSNCYLDKSIEINGPGPRVTVWGARGVDSLFRRSVIEGCTAIRFRDLFDTHESAPVPYVQMNFCQILNPIADPTAPPTLVDAIYWTGTHLDLLGVDISRVAPDPLIGQGTAISAVGNAASVTLRGVTGEGFDIGCVAEDGAHCEQDDAGGPATTIHQSPGVNAFKSGSLAIEATWPAAVYPAVGSNFPDYTGADAQGARVWKRS